MTPETLIEGGCLCGCNRYKIAGKPYATGYCHCTMCRRTSGAPVTAWLSVEKGRFSWRQSNNREFRSSLNVSRFSCSVCGAQMLFKDDRFPNLVSVQIGTLDNASKYAPQFHIYYDDRVTWLEINDDLPKFSAEYTSAKAGS